MPAFCQAAVWTPFSCLIDNRITSFLLKQVADLEDQWREKSMRPRPPGLRIRSGSENAKLMLSGVNSRVSPPFSFGAVGASKTEISKGPLFPFILLYLELVWENL
jgi:hypothetical protein